MRARAVVLVELGPSSLRHWTPMLLFIISAWSACCCVDPLNRLSRSILVASPLVQFIAAIAASPIPTLPPPLLLLRPHLKRRPVDGPRRPLHDIDPHAANAHHARLFVNGQVRLRVSRRAMRHRRRAEDVNRQMSPVRSPGRKI